MASADEHNEKPQEPKLRLVGFGRVFVYVLALIVTIVAMRSLLQGSDRELSMAIEVLFAGLYATS